MAGHRKFALLRQPMSPARRRHNQAAVDAALAAMPLAELRRARDLTQAALAEILDTTQPEVSKIERRTDVYVSTLRRYVEAMGGALEIVARFPDGEVRIEQFGE